MSAEQGNLKFRVDEMGTADQKAVSASKEPESLVSRMGVGISPIPAPEREVPISERTGLVSEFNPYRSLGNRTDVPRLSEPPRRKEL
jgi:hypothetical protein